MFSSLRCFAFVSHIHNRCKLVNDFRTTSFAFTDSRRCDLFYRPILSVNHVFNVNNLKKFFVVFASTQVALPHMRDANFLYCAVDRYRKLLLVRRLRTGEIPTSVLPVDVLLMLRVHALHPTQYVADVRRLYGSDATPAPDVDWATLEYAAAPPAVAHQADCVWRRQFGADETLLVDGSGARGRRSGSSQCDDATAMCRLPRDVASRAAVDCCDITFTALSVDEVFASQSTSLFSSRPRSESWPHHGRIFSVYVSK